MLIPAVINEFYPRWFPLDLLCLHSSVLCKIPVTSIVPCEYVTQLPYCPLHKKSDARVVKLHSDSTQTLLRVCLSVIHPRFAHPRRETPFHADTGTQRVCGRVQICCGIATRDLVQAVQDELLNVQRQSFKGTVLSLNLSCLCINNCKI